MQINTYGTVGVTTGDPDDRSALSGTVRARRHFEAAEPERDEFFASGKAASAAATATSTR